MNNIMKYEVSRCYGACAHESHLSAVNFGGEVSLCSQMPFHDVFGHVRGLVFFVCWVRAIKHWHDFLVLISVNRSWLYDFVLRLNFLDINKILMELISVRHFHIYF